LRGERALLGPHSNPASSLISCRERVFTTFGAGDYEARPIGTRPIRTDLVPPLAAIEAVVRAGLPVRLDVAGYETVGSRGYLATLADHAGRLGAGDRVRVLGTISEDELGVISEQCDIGLALMPIASSDENMRHMAGASNKAFEYLSSGVTPLVSDLPDWRQMFVERGYALGCNPTDVESIAGALRWAAGHREVVREMAARGWERLGLDWNYESQFAPVLQAMLDRPVGGAAAGVPAAVEAECAS
jgi:glycosyltransferase involved in cell wall biosynthesis